MVNSLYPPWMRDLSEEARQKKRKQQIASEKAEEIQRALSARERKRTSDQKKWAEEVAALRNAQPDKEVTTAPPFASARPDEVQEDVIDICPENAGFRQRFRSTKGGPPLPDKDLREIKSMFRDFLGGVVPSGVPAGEEEKFQNVQVHTAAIWLRGGSFSPHELARSMVSAGYEWSDAWRVVNAALAINGEFR